jgi:hypothetical protein
MSIPKVLHYARNGVSMIRMVLTGHQQKTIELLNPWYTGKKVDLGILRTGYLTKISDIVNTRKQILFILG